MGEAGVEIKQPTLSEYPEHLAENLIVDIKIGKPPSMIGKAGEWFFQFCTNILEKPERAGQLPSKYSELDSAKVLRIIHGKDVPNDNNRERIVEIERLKEHTALINEHQRLTPNVQTDADIDNPLGEIANAVIYVGADPHFMQSRIADNTRAFAFKRYFLERTFTNLSDFLGRLRRFSFQKLTPLSPSNDVISPPEALVERGVLRQEMLAEFYAWQTKVVASDIENQTNKNTATILVNLGDVVHDGGSLIDQLGADEGLWQVINELKNRYPKLENIFRLNTRGNHDEDSRQPEAFKLLSIIFGHDIYTQEIGGGDKKVLIASLNTNIESDTWINDFKERTKNDEYATFLLKVRQMMQERVIEKIKQHQGPVVVMGHNPATLYQALAIKRDVVQTSNIQMMIAGHTHQEAHIELPEKNGKGESIAMHVLTSVTGFNPDGKPRSPTLFKLQIIDGKISPVVRLKEPDDQFQNNIEAYANW